MTACPNETSGLATPRDALLGDQNLSSAFHDLSNTLQAVSSAAKVLQSSQCERAGLVAVELRVAYEKGLEALQVLRGNGSVRMNRT